MPRGRPRKKPLEEDIVKTTMGTPLAQPEQPAQFKQSDQSASSKRGRKPTPKDVPTCECCGAPLTNPGSYKVKFNQLLGTGSYRFKAANVSPDLCQTCWHDLLRTLDKWLLSHNIPEKFTNGIGCSTEHSTPDYLISKESE